MSERTIRDWIHRTVNPLPAVQVDRGKLLISRTQLDRWLEAHPFCPSNAIDISKTVDEVMQDFRKVS